MRTSTGQNSKTGTTKQGQAKRQLLAEDLSGVPPALVITAEFDVLRDEGELYSKRLQEEGISVQYTQYRGMLHDFVIFPGLFAQAKEAIDEICIA